MYYALISQPDLIPAMAMVAQGKDVDDFNVAGMRRLIDSQLSRTQAAVTGSVAAPRNISVPRPPNPVRTGPLKTASEPPSDDSQSLAEHERHYRPSSRR